MNKMESICFLGKICMTMVLIHKEMQHVQIEAQTDRHTAIGAS